MDLIFINIRKQYQENLMDKKFTQLFLRCFVTVVNVIGRGWLVLNSKLNNILNFKNIVARQCLNLKIL